MIHNPIISLFIIIIAIINIIILIRYKPIDNSSNFKNDSFGLLHLPFKKNKPIFFINDKFYNTLCSNNVELFRHNNVEFLMQRTKPQDIQLKFYMMMANFKTFFNRNKENLIIIFRKPSNLYEEILNSFHNKKSIANIIFNYYSFFKSNGDIIDSNNVNYFFYDARKTLLKDIRPYASNTNAINTFCQSIKVISCSNINSKTLIFILKHINTLKYLIISFTILFYSLIFLL